MPGPKTQLTPRLILEARRMAMLGLRQSDMAQVFGIARETLSRYRRESPELSQALDQGKQHCDQQVVNALFRNAVELRDTRAQIFWLKNRQPETWQDKQELTHSGDAIKQIVLVNSDGEETVNKLGLAMAKLTPPPPEQGHTE